MVVVSSFESSSRTTQFARRIYIKQQAYHALLSILPYITQALQRDDQSVDSLTDPWALPFQMETEKGTLSVVIYDEDRFLNINSLYKGKVYREIFERLLTLLEISPSYSERVLGWMGKGGMPYQEEYPLKGAPLDSVHELRYMGFSEEDLNGRTVGDVTYPGLLSLLTVYSKDRININTAPKYILMALDPRIDSAIADRIIEFRATKVFKKPQDLVLVEGVTLDILYRIQNVIDVKSSVFRILATVRTGDVETTIELVYDRQDKKVLYRRIY